MMLGESKIQSLTEMSHATHIVLPTPEALPLFYVAAASHAITIVADLTASDVRCPCTVAPPPSFPLGTQVHSRSIHGNGYL